MLRAAALQQETGVSIRKSFQDKKPGRSSGYGRELAPSSMAQLGVKVTSFSPQQHVVKQKGLVAQHLQPLATPCTGVLCRAAREQAQRACTQEPPGCCTVDGGHAHKQNNQLVGSRVALSNAPGCPRTQLCPGTPRCTASTSPSHLRGSRFGLGQSPGAAEQMGSLPAKCPSDLLLPPAPAPKGSLELPTGLSRSSSSLELQSPAQPHTKISRSVI